MKTFVSHSSTINFEQVERLRQINDSKSTFVSSLLSFFRFLVQITFVLSPFLIVSALRSSNGLLTSNTLIVLILIYIITSGIIFQKFFKEKDFLTLYAIVSFVINLVIIFSFKVTFF